MFRKILLGILALLVFAFIGFVAIVAMQSDDLTVTRIETMAAPPEKIFGEINDFHKWEAWSPWAKLDPAMRVAYTGPEAGVGSSYSWIGNDEVGEGKMTITDSRPSDSLKLDLEFIKPFAARNVTEFTFVPDGNKTLVTWTMNGKKNFVMKAFCLVMDMDKMIGTDFEKGLAQLKSKVESVP